MFTFRLLMILLFGSKGSVLAKLLLCNETEEDSICKANENYDKRKVPGDELPLILKPLLMVLDVTEVSEIDHSLTIYIRLAVSWKDPGLLFKRPPSSPLLIAIEYLRKSWTTCPKDTPPASRGP